MKTSNNDEDNEKDSGPDVSKRSDGNKPDSQKGLSRLSQKFAMRNVMTRTMNESYFNDDIFGGAQLSMIASMLTTPQTLERA